MDSKIHQAESNKTILEQFWKGLQSKLQGNDVDLSPYLAKDIVWHLPQSTFPAGEPQQHQGKQAVLAMFEGEVENYYQPASMQFDIHSIIAEDDRVHFHFSLRAKTAQGNDYFNHYQALYRLKDGQIAEVWEYFDTAYLFRLFNS